MSRQRFQPISQGEDVPPACIRLVDGNGHPLGDNLIVLTKSKNALELKSPTRVGKIVKVDFVNDAWMLQEVNLIKGELQNKYNCKPVKLVDQMITAIGTRTRTIRFLFFANLIEVLPMPNVIASQNAAMRAIKEIEEELICSICLQVFTEPFIVNCGHTFCKSCWHQWKRLMDRPPCPLCQQNITVELFNRPLRNFYESLEKLKDAIKSTPAVPEAPPELIILDDEEAAPLTTVSHTIVSPCSTVPRFVESIEDDVIIIE